VGYWSLLVCLAALVWLLLGASGARAAKSRSGVRSRRSIRFRPRCRRMCNSQVQTCRGPVTLTRMNLRHV
jgi:hypothetical protein